MLRHWLSVSAIQAVSGVAIGEYAVLKVLFDLDSHALQASSSKPRSCHT